MPENTSLYSHGVSSLCQETKHQLYFTIFTHLLKYLQYFTFQSNSTYLLLKHAHFTAVINKYFKCQIEQILYMSTTPWTGQAMDRIHCSQYACCVLTQEDFLVANRICVNVEIQ